MSNDPFEDEVEEQNWQTPPPPAEKCPQRLPGPFLSCILILSAGFAMMIGVAGLMAEGPHGPAGEITGDPGAPWRLLFATLIAVVLLVFAGKCWSGPKSGVR